MIRTQLRIGDSWADSDRGETIEVRSPWDNEVVGHFQAASVEQVNSAFAAAGHAFGSWKNSSVAERLEIFERIHTRILQEKDNLANVLSAEIGKTKEAAVIEVERSAAYLKLVMQALAHMKGSVYAGDVTGSYPRGRKTGYYTREPLGVIVAISSFNYPLNLSVTKIAPALLAGNTVVFKPAAQGSIAAGEFYRLFIESGLPAGVLNIVTGHSREIGDTLVTHPLTKLIAFTGSTAVGNHIAELAKGIPLLLELGGKDTAIVTAKADLNIAASEITAGGFSYCGQRCTAQKLVLAYEEIADELVERIVQQAAGLELNPMIDNKAADYIMELIADATEKGAARVLEGSRDGNRVKANVLDHVNPMMRVFSEEQFGPVLPVVRVKGEQDALEKHNLLEFGLQASVYTQDIEEAFRYADRLEVGTVQINGRSDRGPDNYPFGGIKSSGQYMQGTLETLELMTRGKLTVLNLHNFSA